jgi:hypothetical protein
MIGGLKSVGTPVVVAILLAALAVPAFSQTVHSNKGASGPPVENRPKIDEKAYKAALDRIPEARKKYDPWEIARPSEPVSADKKPN